MHLRVVDHKDLDPNLAALNHAGKIGLTIILDPFLLVDVDPLVYPPGDVMGASFEGDGFEEVDVDLVEHQPNPSVPKLGLTKLTNSKMNSDSSLD